MACGYFHTITVSYDGIAHSFGRNGEGQLGLGHNNSVSLPTPIPNLPKINQLACGDYFTVCVDYEDFIWSFGYNSYGQLGTGNKTFFNVPQKILNIPPVLFISCGLNHTLIITTIIYGHVKTTSTDNYVTEIPKIHIIFKHFKNISWL